MSANPDTDKNELDRLLVLAEELDRREERSGARFYILVVVSILCCGVLVTLNFVSALSDTIRIITDLTAGLLTLLVGFYSYRKQRRTWITDRRALNAALSILYESSDLVASDDAWSPLQRAEYKIRLSRLGLSRESQIENSARIVDRLREDDFKAIRDIFSNSWKQREPDIKKLFENAARQSNKEALRSFLEKTFLDLRQGQFLGAIDLTAWDFTLSAISLEGQFIFHPSFPPGQRIAQGSIMERVLRERTGDFFWVNKLISEQLHMLFQGNVGAAIGGLNNRVTRVYFSAIGHLESIVVMECHVNVIDRLPKISIAHGPNNPSIRPSPDIGSMSPQMVKLLTLVAKSFNGVLSSDLKSLFPALSETRIRAIVDQAKTLGFLEEQNVDSARGLTRIHVTGPGRDLLQIGSP